MYNHPNLGQLKKTHIFNACSSPDFLTSIPLHPSLSYTAVHHFSIYY